MPTLLIVGDGPVSEALVPLSEGLGWSPVVATDLDVVDDRLPGSDAVVVLSHHEGLDGPALQRALDTEIGYIGAMGSRRTQARRADWLEAQGVTDRRRIHGPAGLDIGADEPPEIALAILAELVAVRRGHAGAGSLRDRSGPIHPELAPGDATCPGG